MCTTLLQLLTTSGPIIEAQNICLNDTSWVVLAIGFQPTVRELIAEDCDVIDEEQRLMDKLRTPLMQAQLFPHTHLKAKLDNKTRWTSMYDM